jgi:hypothetical protein
MSTSQTLISPSPWQTVPADVILILIDILEDRDLEHSFQSVQYHWKLSKPIEWPYACGLRLRQDLAAAVFHLCGHWRRIACSQVGDRRPLFRSIAFRWIEAEEFLGNLPFQPAQEMLNREIEAADVEFDVRVDTIDGLGLDYSTSQFLPILTRRTPQ